MESYRININYAKALLLLATETDQQDATFSDMRLVNEVCIENHVLNVVFNNPVIKEAKKVAILHDLFGEKISKLSMLFLSFVVKKRRTINLRGISNAYLELYRDRHNIVLSELITAVEVNPESLDLVRRLIGNYTQKEVELVSRTDNNMLGGFRMMFNNNMYDARIHSKIVKLRKEFRKNTYESKL